MSVQYGELRPTEIGSGVWGTPANFNGVSRLGFVTAQRRSPEPGGQPNCTTFGRLVF